MIGNKEIAMNLKPSLWQLLHPSITQASKEIHEWMSSLNSSSFALIIISLENAAPILLCHGEDFLNNCMKKVTDTIKHTLESDLKVLRISINHLVVICPFQDRENFSGHLNNFFSSLNKASSKIAESSVYLSIRCGATILNKDASLYTCLDQAFIALYESQVSEMNSVCFYDQVSERMTQYQNEMKMASYFQGVLENKKCKLAFQPIIDSKTGKVKSYETLLRIITEDEQIVSAGPFIHIAEKFDFIHQVDELTLEMAVRELRLNSQVNLSVNVSTSSISNNKWIKIAKELLKEPQVASRLIVEITETGIHKNLNTTIEFVDSLQAIGCKVAIDDFGAGYTSFTQLKLLNADIIKIDGLFVRDIAENHDSKLFVKTLLEFAKAFCLQTTAEYVETGEIAKILMELGVDYMQGHYFGKALNYRPWIKDEKE